jgi:hypothetical protein
MDQLDPEQKEPKQPRITLVTDFVSDVFIQKIHNNQDFRIKINKFDFQVIVIGNVSATHYYNSNALQHKQITTAMDFNSIPSEKVCRDPYGNVSSISSNEGGSGEKWARWPESLPSLSPPPLVTPSG